jgi:hypothetical protein
VDALARFAAWTSSRRTDQLVQMPDGLPGLVQDGDEGRAQTKAARRPTIEYMESRTPLNSASLLDDRDVRVVGVDRLRHVPARPVHDLAQLLG